MSDETEDFATMFEASVKAKRFDKGQTIEGLIVGIGPEVAFVDVGGKGEAVVDVEWRRRGEFLVPVPQVHPVPDRLILGRRERRGRGESEQKRGRQGKGDREAAHGRILQSSSEADARWSLLRLEIIRDYARNLGTE